MPADLPEGMRLESQPVLTALPAGPPSRLLLRRPTSSKAATEPRAANADIGAA